MRCLVLIAVVITVAAARPEMYREKEDFQYSRSSSDDGSKSGYYGAQRGNMGGNYEKAHNMDTLAQHQMSGLIHQVDGEIGDTSKTNAGNVYAAANSRGMYGSGHYDLGNLEGRNFQEGTSYGDSHSQSALTNSAYRNHASGLNSYSNSNSYAHSSRHSNSERSEHEQRKEIHSSNLRSGENAYQQELGAYGSSSNQDYSWSPYQNRLVSTRPMKILVRPGTRVTVPIATQTYDAEHSASLYDTAAYNQHAAKNDAEVIINNDHETTNRHVPASKHYESSYSYRKEWEKHNSSPGAVPLGVDIDSSIPKTSELYDDSQQTQTYNQNHRYASNAADSHSHSSNLYGYSSGGHLASASQSRHQSDYDVQRERLSSDLNALNLNTQQSNLNQDFANQQALSSKPKSYQSSYSYHKSWERQGDPYVIVPVPSVQNGQTSQRLSAASDSHSGYSSHQYGSNVKQSHQSYSSNNGLMDCDDEGHKRVARSYDMDQEVQQQQNGWEDFGQQSQNLLDDQKAQTQWDKIEDFGQQTQTQFDKIEDLGQQTQSEWDKIQDLGQQTQTHFDKIEDLGQQSQDKWENFKDLGQQTQTHFDKLEDLGQQSQNKWDKVEDLGQHTQTQFDKFEDLGQQAQNHWEQSQDLGQQSKHQWDKSGEIDQHKQREWDLYNEYQRSQSSIGQEQAVWNKLESSNEDKQIHNIYRDQSNSNTVSDDVTHYTDKQTENSHKEQTVQQQNDFYPHLPDDFQTHYTDDSKTQHTSSINSLWDKLDRLSGESTFNSNHKTNEYSSILQTEYQSYLPKETTTTEKNIVNDTNIVNPNDLGRGDVPDIAVVNPKNTGRGDIPDTPESQSFLRHASTTEKTNVASSTATSFEKKNKTENESSQQIEALSLVASHHKSTEKPNIQSDKTEIHHEKEIMNQQSEHSRNSQNVNHYFQNEQVSEEKEKYHNSQDFNQQNEQNMKQDRNFDLNESYNKEHVEQGHVDFSKLNGDFEQQNMNHHYGGFDQQNKNLDQQNMEQGQQMIEKPIVVVDQQNLEQNLVDFSTLNENFEQNMDQHFGNPAETIDQQNLEQNLVDFSGWNENLNHQSLDHHLDSFDQQNMQSFDKSSVSLDQQTLNQKLEDFSQFDENAHSNSFHQQSENLDQNKLVPDSQSFDRPNNGFDQQNLNQNLEEFSQLSENAHQQSHNFKHDDNLDQQNMEQELQSFDKLSNSFDQQNMDHQLQDFDKPFDNFDQQSLNQNLMDFDQQGISHNFERVNQQNENSEQQNMGQELQNFDKPIEIFEQQTLNQNLKDFSQFDEKFEQQYNNPTDFEKQDQNLNKDTLQPQTYNQQFHFGTARENFDQQTLHQSLGSAVSENEIVPRHASESKSEHLDMQQNNNPLLPVQYTEQHIFSQTTLAPEPEKTGFWASVGKKFTSAKDKVTSWFRKKSV